MHPDSSRAWIHEKLGLQLYSYHARTENSENSDLTYSLNLSSTAVLRVVLYLPVRYLDTRRRILLSTYGYV